MAAGEAQELELDAMRDSEDPVQSEMLLSFRHEVSRMAFLRHPNVVSFYGIVWRVTIGNDLDAYCFY